MPGDVQILAAGTASVPVAYEVPASQEIVVRAVRGVFDGGSASGDFVPVLQFISDAGIIAVACPVCSTIAAGGSADVSWFPGVKNCCRDSDDSGTAAGITALASFNGTLEVTNPTGPTTSLDLPASGVTAATYGDGTHVSQVTVDAEGRVTAAADVAITIVGGTVSNVASSGGTITVTNGGGPNVNIDLPASGVAAGSYGDATHVSAITVDAQGRLTAASSVSITGSGSVASADGWVDDTAETWTYASATTFTVGAIDLTAKYSTGTRLKLTQGGTTKYFVVVSSSFGGGTTTVTLTGGSDYTFANAAVSANYHSYAVNPQGYPGWFNWNAATTGYGSTSSVYSKFCVIGRACFVHYRVAGTSNATSKAMTLPIAPANAASVYKHGLFQDGVNGVVEARTTVSGSTMTFQYQSTYTPSLAFSSTGWAASGTCVVQFDDQYEI